MNISAAKCDLNNSMAMERIFGRRLNEIIQQPFRWTAGIEGSIVPHLDIDQYRWTQHDRFWRDDFRLAAFDLKCRWLRYSLPWQQLEPEPGQFNWEWSDERFAVAGELGLKLMVDLVHFGVPTWLPGAFADVDFPRSLERFAAAFGRRYNGHPAVPTVCPINEPLTTTFFCGDAGLWPPHGHGLRDYMTVLARVAEAFCRAVRSLRQTMPDAEILICDSLETAITHEPDSSEKTSPYLRESLGADVARRMQRRHIVTDLITGRIDERHPLYGWMTGHGFSPFDLVWFRQNAQDFDILGLDYYNHTEVEIYTSADGQYQQRINPNPLGLYRGAPDYWRRYLRPLMVTETSVTGTDEERIAWLNRCVEDIRRLRGDGIPVIGYTWWPLFDHVDWDGAMLHQTGHVHPVGIYALQRQSDDTLRRTATPLTDAYGRLLSREDEAVGQLDSNHLVLPSPPRSPRAQRSQIRYAPLIVYSRHLWSPVWQRIHHIVARLQRERPVLFVETRWVPNSVRLDARLRQEAGLKNLHILSVPLPYSAQSTLDGGRSLKRTAIELALQQEPDLIQFRRSLLWFEDPLDQPIFGPVAEPLGSVFDCHDAYALDQLSSDRSLHWAKPADLIFFRSTTLFRKFEPALNGRAALVADGVDPIRFARASREKTRVPFDLDFVRFPVLGFVGTIDQRLDFDVIQGLIDDSPVWKIVMIGPVSGVSPEHLCRREHTFWVGPRPYHQLGHYLRKFDVCIMPYRTDGAAEFHLPAKTREYLMAGRPIVSTRLPELEGAYGDLITTAGNASEFVSLCHEALRNPDRKRLRNGMRTALSRTWAQVAGEVHQHLQQLTGVIAV